MPTLSISQRAILKADIDADPTFASLPNTNANADLIVSAYNSFFSPDWFAWQTKCPVSDIYDAIQWANMTPSDAPDGTALYTNRALFCQAKQISVQIMLQGRDIINCSKLTLQAGLQDALTGYVSGASGAVKSGGWVAVRAVMQRKATRAEKLFASGTGTAATPGFFTFEGKINQDDVTSARDGA